MKSNLKHKDKFKNKRCFIVGNGPSLNKLDLTKLSNEIVFTVNNIMTNKEIYKKVFSDYHVLVDPTYFNLTDNRPEDKATIDLLKSINYENKKPECIISYEGRIAFKKYGLDTLLNLNYVFQHRNLKEKYSKRISMCSNMPTSQNVIQTAIYSAIYMGFSKIYLIGCDMTSVFLTYVANDEGDRDIVDNFHAYEYTDSEKRTMLLDSEKNDNEYMLYDYAKTFTIFKRIRRYSEKNEVEILNATKGGGLDVFQRTRYESLFE